MAGYIHGLRGAPAFPDFKPLEMSDRPAIEAFTESFDPYSGFRFSTLFFYNINNHTHWCWLNGNLVLRLRDGFGPGTYLTFLGVQKAAETAAAVIDYATRRKRSDGKQAASGLRKTGMHPIMFTVLNR